MIDTLKRVLVSKLVELIAVTLFASHRKGDTVGEDVNAICHSFLNLLSV
jgi:hypothetical protein